MSTHKQSRSYIRGKRAKLLTCSGGNETGGKFPIHCSIYTQEDNRQGGKDTNTVGDTTQSPMTQETMTELVECNTASTRL